MGKHYGLECETIRFESAVSEPEIAHTSDAVVALRNEISRLLLGNVITGVLLDGGDLISRVVDVRQIYLSNGTVIDFWPYAAGRFPAFSLKSDEGFSVGPPAFDPLGISVTYVQPAIIKPIAPQERKD